MSMSSPDQAASILQTIGRTPVVKLNRLASAGAADVFVKLEFTGLKYLAGDLFNA